MSLAPATLTPPVTPADAELANTCNLLAAVSFPSRLRILRHLAGMPAPIESLAEVCGYETADGLIGPLDLLRSAGLIEFGELEGKPLYRITGSGRRLVEGIGLMVRRRDS